MEGDFRKYYINGLYTTHAVVCWVTAGSSQLVAVRELSRWRCRPGTDSMDSRIACWSYAGSSPISPLSRRRAPLINRRRPAMVLVGRVGKIPPPLASPYTACSWSRREMSQTRRKQQREDTGSALSGGKICPTTNRMDRTAGCTSWACRIAT
jgi:hypothetical protein